MFGTTLLLIVLLSGIPVQDPYQRAVASFQEGRFEEVISLLSQLPTQEANRPAPYNLRALALSELRRYDEAIAAIQHALELDPSNPNYVYNAGAIYLAKQDFHQAERIFHLAIQRFPQSSRLYQGLGETLYNLKKYRQAEQWLHKAVEIDPASAPAHVSLASLFYSLGDRENFGAAASKAIQLDPENYQACYHYGKWLIEDRGQIAEGRQFILKSIRLAPRFIDGLKAWGRLLSRQGDWEKAAQIYEKALAIDSKNKELYYLLSIAYRKIGRPEKAERALNEYAKQLRP